LARLGCWHVGGDVGSFQPAGRNGILAVAHLHAECAQGSGEDQVGTIVQGRQGWHVSVAANKHVGSCGQAGRELGRSFVSCYCVVGRLRRHVARHGVLQLLVEAIRWLRLAQELPREDERRPVNSICWAGVGVFSRSST